MKKKIDPKHFASVCDALQNSDCKTATKYIDAHTVVRATWRHRPRYDNRLEEMVVTLGCPNYREREFINKCKKICKDAGEPFHVITDIMLKPFPVKKKKK